MYDFKDKKTNIQILNHYMLSKTLSMFDYTGLPDSIPSVELEKQLQQFGNTFIYQHTDGEIYALKGTKGGEVDVYGNGTTIVLTNPALKLSETVDLDSGVYIGNDDLEIGLLPLFNRYNRLLTENEITMMMNNINNRVQMLMSAGDDETLESAKEFLDKLIDGEVSVIAENRVFEGLKTHTSSSTSTQNITDLIEFNQYLKSNLYNEIGIDLNHNMKRERLNSDEIALNEEHLFPLVNNMLENRMRAVDEMNEKWGLNVKVEYGSIWKKRSPHGMYTGVDESDDDDDNDDDVDDVDPDETDDEIKGVDDDVVE